MSLNAVFAEGNKTTLAATILIVEDERIVARSLRNQLTSLGYEVVGNVPSGEEAIQKAGELRPDLVLMDIYLEGSIDGVEAAAAIRSRFRLPVVYVTAYSNREILDRAKLTEPNGYILKPYDERELNVVIETALYKHRMERRQQEREHWFAATLRSIADAVVATDDEGRITYMNPQAERLTGWSNHDALGQQVEEVVRLVSKGTGQPVSPPTTQDAPGDLPISETLLLSRDGSPIDVECSLSLIKDEQGVTLGGVMVFRDVTWRKHLEEQSRQAKKMEAVGQLAGGVAHALNNLMTIVLGHSDIILGGRVHDMVCIMPRPDMV